MAKSLLTAAIRGAFKRPVWVAVPGVCDGAEFLLRPLPIEVEQKLMREHEICTECGGYGKAQPQLSRQLGELAHLLADLPLPPETRAPLEKLLKASEPQECETCKGQSPRDASSPVYHLALIQHTVVSWRKLFADDPLTGELETEETPYDDETRDALALVPAAVSALRAAARDLVYRVRDEGKAASTPPPSAASPTEEAPAGNVDSESGS